MPAFTEVIISLPLKVADQLRSVPAFIVTTVLPSGDVTLYSFAMEYPAALSRINKESNIRFIINMLLIFLSLIASFRHIFRPEDRDLQACSD